jgi:hypothetical protein
LLFNFALEHVIRRVQVNQNGMKLNGIHQLLLYADELNILRGSVHTIKKNAGTSVVASNETELEVNADKTTQMTISQDQNVKGRCSLMVDNPSYGRMEELKHLGKTLTNQYCIQENIKSRLKSGNSCCHSCRIFCFPVC